MLKHYCPYLNTISTPSYTCTENAVSCTPDHFKQMFLSMQWDFILIRLSCLVIGKVPRVRGC